MKIGIGITTHNRNDLFAETFEKIKYFTPDAKIVVVDDSSDNPVVMPDATAVLFRFNSNAGIAVAKNKCLELLDDCDHIFLFDDDTYPIVSDWWKPYVESSEPHLMYCFDKWSNGSEVGDDLIYYRDDSIEAHTAARGCMVYIDNKILNIVGGLDTAYGKAMNEHGDWSNRIYNAGLTAFKHADVIGSKKLIYSADEHQAVSSSIAREVRANNLVVNNAYLAANNASSDYKEYRRQPYGVVITTYLTCGPDLQRGMTWLADYDATKVLRDSVDGKLDLYLLNDCFDEGEYGTIHPVNVKSYGNPYFMRWLAIWRFLASRPDITDVWLVDSTDTELLVDDPFGQIQPGLIYTGDESSVAGSDWMLGVVKDAEVRRWINEHAEAPLLNCGVVGGHRDDIMEICRAIYERWVAGGCKEIVEMPIYNALLRSQYNNRLAYGRGTTTAFKKFERTGAIWRHK